MIKINNLSLGYGSDVVLDNISLQINKGEMILFTGSNGTGKTTLLRGILGLLKPIKGQIINSFSTKSFAYVPQFSHIDNINPITVKEIISTGPVLLNNKNNNIDNSIIKLFGLYPYLNKSFRDLSGGIKQRTLLARALQIQSDILILDEATSQLDRESEDFILNYIFNLNKKHGKTILMASHHYDLQEKVYSKFIKYKIENKKVIKEK